MNTSSTSHNVFAFAVSELKKSKSPTKKFVVTTRLSKREANIDKLAFELSSFDVFTVREIEKILGCDSRTANRCAGHLMDAGLSVRVRDKRIGVCSTYRMADASPTNNMVTSSVVDALTSVKSGEVHS